MNYAAKVEVKSNREVKKEMERNEKEMKEIKKK